MSNFNVNAKPFNPRPMLKDEHRSCKQDRCTPEFYSGEHDDGDYRWSIQPPMQPPMYPPMHPPMHHMHQNPWYPPPKAFGSPALLGPEPPYPYPPPHHQYPMQMPVFGGSHPQPQPILVTKSKSEEKQPIQKIEVLEIKKVTRDMEIQTDPIKEEKKQEVKEQEVKKRCNCRCIHTDVYPIPKGYSPEEATLWKKIRPPTKLARISNTLCVGEPDDLSFVRSNMLLHKFKLNKVKITDNTYYIKSVKTPETSPEFMDFQIYYRDDNQMPYKTFVRLRTMSKIQEYDVDHNCRLTMKVTIPKDKKKIYKQTFDYENKQKLLEVTDSETHEVLHTEMLTGECWLENEFIYR